MSDCDSYAMGTRSLFADVGYTLRFFGDWLGVSQTTLNFDIAVPLLTPLRRCFGDPTSKDAAHYFRPGTRSPVGFFFAFAAPW